MAKTFIQIEGQTLDPSGLTLPTSRENRDAWSRNGDVVEVDPAKVAALKEEKAAELERSIMDDTGTLKVIANVIADVAFKISAGQIPGNLNQARARAYVRNEMRMAIREELGLGPAQ